MYTQKNISKPSGGKTPQITDSPGQDLVLSHKEATAASPYENTGEEDPGAALESLVTDIEFTLHKN